MFEELQQGCGLPTQDVITLKAVATQEVSPGTPHPKALFGQVVWRLFFPIKLTEATSDLPVKTTSMIVIWVIQGVLHLWKFHIGILHSLSYLIVSPQVCMPGKISNHYAQVFPGHFADYFAFPTIGCREEEESLPAVSLSLPSPIPFLIHFLFNGLFDMSSA